MRRTLRVIAVHPDPRRYGVRERHACGAALQGRENHRDLRRHERDPETGHCGAAAQGEQLVFARQDV